MASLEFGAPLYHSELVCKLFASSSVHSMTIRALLAMKASVSLVTVLPTTLESIGRAEIVSVKVDCAHNDNCYSIHISFM